MIDYEWDFTELTTLEIIELFRESKEPNFMKFLKEREDKLSE